MHHIALDGAGPHDGHLYHQVIKTLRPEPWQHGLLCAAFDLKYAYGIGTTHHFVHGRIVLRNTGQGELKTIVLFGQVECLADTRKHAQGQYIDL